MTKLKLTVNETKTRVCKLPEEEFDFLGYTFGRCYSPKTGRAYIGTVPSKKRVIRICEAISEMTGRKQTLLDQEMVVAKFNRTMIGWANYFCLGPVSKAYRAVEQHARKRLLANGQSNVSVRITVIQCRPTAHSSYRLDGPSKLECA
jgi:RNA-directed DNA polymerase